MGNDILWWTCERKVIRSCSSHLEPE
ncbi:hypothetical protein Avbf_18028 [Armadillidium vulgare]|nr:hypothetical protein Avbf_18028 [Armadillidium vulgare]